MNDKELREQMSTLPEPPTDSRPPFWDFWRHDLWQHVVNGDHPDNFASWPSIFHTMRVDHWRDATDIEFDRLLESVDNQRWMDACRMPDIGEKRDYYNLFYSASLVHQMHHLYQFQRWARLDISEIDSIFEFGAGYGAMALVAHRLGFHGQYTILDLPEFTLLQQYFLSRMGVSGVNWLPPDDKTLSLDEPTPYDLFIACYSLSEVDSWLRYRVLRYADAKHYLFLYSERFDSYDNVAYFQSYLPDIQPDVEWHTRHADHLPDRNYYTFGRRM